MTVGLLPAALTVDVCASAISVTADTIIVTRRRTIEDGRNGWGTQSIECRGLRPERGTSPADCRGDNFRSGLSDCDAEGVRVQAFTCTEVVFDNGRNGRRSFGAGTGTWLTTRDGRFRRAYFDNGAGTGALVSVEDLASELRNARSPLAEGDRRYACRDEPVRMVVGSSASAEEPPSPGAAPAASPPAPASAAGVLSGAWISGAYRMTLHQAGSAVEGTYVHGTNGRTGSLTGRLDAADRLLTGRWRETGQSGTFVWRFDAAWTRFDGHFGVGDAAPTHGWSGRRAADPAPSLPVAATSSSDDEGPASVETGAQRQPRVRPGEGPQRDRGDGPGAARPLQVALEWEGDVDLDLVVLGRDGIAVHAAGGAARRGLATSGPSSEERRSEWIRWESAGGGQYVACALGDAGAGVRVTYRVSFDGRNAERTMSLSGNLGRACTRAARGFLVGLRLPGIEARATATSPTLLRDRIAQLAGLGAATHRRESSEMPGVGSDRDDDGVPDALDDCPGEREAMNGHSDHDGCPDDSTFDDLLVHPFRVSLRIGVIHAEFTRRDYFTGEPYVASRVIAFDASLTFRIYGVELSLRNALFTALGFSVAVSPLTLGTWLGSPVKQGFGFEPAVGVTQLWELTSSGVPSTTFLDLTVRLYQMWAHEYVLIGLDVTTGLTVARSNRDSYEDSFGSWYLAIRVDLGFGEML